MSSSMCAFVLLFICFPSQVDGVHQSPPQIVEENTTVTISCSHDDTSRPVMLWYQQRESHSQSIILIGFGYGGGTQSYEGQFEEEFELKRESTLKGALIIRRASPVHSAVYFCAANRAKSVEFQQSLPKIANVTDRVEIKCSHNDNELYVMLWYQQRQNGQLSLMGFSYDTTNPNYEEQFVDQIEISRESRQQSVRLHGAHLSRQSDRAAQLLSQTERWRLRYGKLGWGKARQDERSEDRFLSDAFSMWGQGGNYEAYFGLGTKLTVLDSNHTVTLPKVKVLKPSKKECERKGKTYKKKTLVCLVYGFYPDHVNVFWLIDGVKVTDGVATDNTAQKAGQHYNITSRLTVGLREWLTEGANFTCAVEFFRGNGTVQCSDWIIGVDDRVNRDKYLRITNNAKLSYAVLIIKSSIYGVFVVFLVWWLQRSPGKQND
ncbi:uncharacterized protein LOC104932216 [Larimichthys crocea]|uniref:uncharacterized protein LOC104932216 n=1 Tax=Larimichthys crocea TaxID=215358 RepID=UPI000F5E81EF|nr:uncharacterized protein LOC104932216 [Larimichthys crocea]